MTVDTTKEHLKAPTDTVQWR